MKRSLLLWILALLLLCPGCGRRGGQPDSAPKKSGEASAFSDEGAGQPPSDPENPAEPQKPSDPDEGEAPSDPEDPDAAAVPEVWTPTPTDPTAPMVALTFDDGPDETYSDLLLDILEENHAVATFFEVGRNVARCPDPLARMAELGCEIGSHSYSHKDLSTLSGDSLQKDMVLSDEAFLSATGAAPTLLRPPYGAVNKAVKFDTGHSVITWTVDTQDWLKRDAGKVVDYIQSYGDLDGQIVLMHSTYESTVEAVRVLVPWLQEQGYQLVTVTELMAYYYGDKPEEGEFFGYTYFHSHSRTDTPLSLEPDDAAAQTPAQAPSDAPAEAPAQNADTPVKPELPAGETGSPAGEAGSPAGEAGSPAGEAGSSAGEAGSSAGEPETPAEEPALPPEDAEDLPGTGEAGGNETALPPPTQPNPA